MAAKSAPPCRCNGTGKIQYVHREPDDVERDLGNGFVAGPMTTYGTHPCPCRATLEPREGDARWWYSERVYQAVWDGDIYQSTIEIMVNAEVPYSEDNYRVVRRGNRYYPTMVDVELGAPHLLMHVDAARDLARMLTEAADKCDEIDGPDADECGHWHPCNCRTEQDGGVPF